MKAYEVWGDGVETSIIRRGKIIYGNSPKDALSRAHIANVKRRLTSKDKTPPRWIVVRRVDMTSDGIMYYTPNHPANYYEV